MGRNIAFPAKFGTCKHLRFTGPVIMPPGRPGPVCRPAGILSVPGVYGGLSDKLPFGAVMNKGLTLRTGQGPDMYKVFRDKQDNCIKVVLKP